MDAVVFEREHSFACLSFVNIDFLDSNSIARWSDSSDFRGSDFLFEVEEDDVDDCHICVEGRESVLS